MSPRWKPIRDESGTTRDPVRSLELPSLALCDFELEAGHESRRHQHGVDAWVLGVSGALALPTAHGTLEIAAGGFRWLPDDLAHHERAGPRGARCFLVRPSGALAQRLGPRRSTPDTVRSPELGELARRLARLVESDDPLARIEAEGAALMALAIGCRLAERRDPAPWLARVRAALEDDPRATWTHPELAALAGVTPEHLARRFRRHFGCTLATYLRRRRLERALRLVRETRADLTAIALATGFADHSHFTRSFRATFGTTPSAYRRG